MRKLYFYILDLLEETHYIIGFLGLLSIGIGALGTWLVTNESNSPQYVDFISLVTASSMFLIWGVIGIVIFIRKEAPLFLIYPTGISAMLTGFLLTLISFGFLIWFWVKDWEIIFSFIGQR